MRPGATTYAACIPCCATGPTSPRKSGAGIATSCWRIPAIVRKAGLTLKREQIVPVETTAIAAGTTPIVIVDPLVPAQIDQARTLVASQGGRIRLIWRGAQAMNDVEEQLIGDTVVAGAIEGWIWPPD